MATFKIQTCTGVTTSFCDNVIPCFTFQSTGNTVTINQDGGLVNFEVLGGDSFSSRVDLTTSTTSGITSNTYTYVNATGGTETWCTGGLGLFDHHGGTLALNDCNKEIILHRSLGTTGSLHGGSIGSDDLIVNTVDSDEGALVGITTKHDKSVISVSNGTNRSRWAIVSGRNNENDTDGFASFITGGQANTPIGNYNDGRSVLGSGVGNINNSLGDYTIISGVRNENDGQASLVVGSSNINTATGDGSIIGGGNRVGTPLGNTNSGVSSIVAGTGNNNSGGVSLVIGQINTNSGQQAIIGGQDNINQARNTIIGGRNNTVSGTEGSFVMGVNNSQLDNRATGIFGPNNIFQPSSVSSLIVGETNNATSYSSLLVGRGNSIFGQVNSANSFVLGQNNILPTNMGSSAIIGGNTIAPTTQGSVAEDSQVYVPYLHLWGGNPHAAVGVASGPQILTAAQYNALNGGNGGYVLVVDPDDEFEVKMMTKAEFDLI